MKICTDKNKPKTRIKDYILITENPNCEHCGKLLPYDPVLVSGTNWCLPCALAGPNFEINELTAEQIFNLVIEKKREFFEKELSLLDKLTINDVVPV